MDDLIAFIKDEYLNEFLILYYNERKSSLIIKNISDSLVKIHLSLEFKDLSYHIVGRNDFEILNVVDLPSIGEREVCASGYLILPMTLPEIEVIAEGISKRIYDDDVRVSMFNIDGGNHKIIIVNGFSDMVFVRVDYSDAYKIYYVRSKASVILKAEDPTCRLGNRTLSDFKTIKMRRKDNSLSFEDAEDLFDKRDLESLYDEPTDY